MAERENVVEVIAQDIYEYVEFLIDESKIDRDIFIDACKMAIKKVRKGEIHDECSRKAG